MTTADEDDLRALEESLWDPGKLGDSASMDSILAEGFIEFGRSGRIYDRQVVLQGSQAPFDAKLPLPDLTIRWLTDDVALVTYRSEVRHDAEILAANRASVWRRDHAGWRLEFHQGTPVEIGTDRFRHRGTQ